MKIFGGTYNNPADGYIYEADYDLFVPQLLSIINYYTSNWIAIPGNNQIQFTFVDGFVTFWQYLPGTVNHELIHRYGRCMNADVDIPISQWD